MSCRATVYQWQTVIATHLPHLSKPQAAVLALWSLGMILTRSCALTAVTLVVATALGRKEAAVRQQVREFCYEATAKAGQQRTALVVADCFVPLLRWVVSWWQGSQLALALDATTLGQRFVVLAISVLYRGCAIPVAWCIVPAQTTHAWRGEWLRLLGLLRPAIPPTWTVIVLADRGLYARWLFRRIVRLGWHPLLRVNAGGTFRPEGCARFARLSTLVPAPGLCWCGRGTAFQDRESRLACTLLARWEEGCREPWLLLTDLPPEACDACWYGLRAWIEQGFKLTKRGGWQWQRTRMTNPERAARLWLAVAVATLWLLSVGGQADAAIPESTVPEVADVLRVAQRRRKATRLRLVSVVRRGWALVLAAVLHQQPLPQGRLVPEPWPLSPPAQLTSSKVVAHATT